MEGLIINTVAISRSGELKHFEIPLSKNAEYITGLWYKIRLLDDARIVPVVTKLVSQSPYQPEIMVGTLSLSSNQREGVFFYGNLMLEDENYGLLDYTKGVFPVNKYRHNSWGKNLQVKVDADTAIVHGFILDNWGVLSGRNVRYEVDIYIYEKLKEKVK